MRILLAVCISFAGSAYAQNAIYVMPPSPRTPVGGIQSVTAVVTGNTNKAVTWSTTCGTLVGSGNTIGLKSTTVQNCKVTATMDADGVTAASSTVTFEAVRTDLQAAGIHPRIGLTPADVADLRTKAAAGKRNVVYTQGLQAIFAYRQAYYNAHFCWSGAGCGTPGPIGTLNPATGWIDSTQCFYNNCGGSFEQDTALYALMALIDPNTGNRATWAAHAHDMAMWEINEQCYGAASGSGACVPRNYANSSAPFIGSGFIVANRAQLETLPQIEGLDWNYSSLTSSDKATIASLFHIWGQQLTGSNIYDQVSGPNESPHPVGTYSSPALFNSNIFTEQGGLNNYGMGQFQSTVDIGLLLDPADDPAVSSCAPTTTTICATDGSAQTVGAYGVSAVKAWLYRNYAALEDQHIVDYAYGIADPNLCPDTDNPAGNSNTINCTGSQSGGFLAEGTEYGPISATDFFGGLYTLYIAGKLNPATDPQASLISSSFWDRMAVSFVQQLYPNASGGGNYIQIGDDQAWSVQLEQGYFFNAKEVYDAKYGSSWAAGIDKWYQYNALLWGQPNYAMRWLGTSGGGYSIWGGWLYDIGLMEATSATNDGDFSNPSYAPNPTPNQYDPRNTTTLPLDYENISSPGGFYRYYGRNNFTTSATQFQFGCNTAVQDHAFPTCGRFDYLRDGEPLITALGGNFGSVSTAQAPSNQDIAGYQWNPSWNCSNATVWQNLCSQGGEMPGGYINFSNTVLAHSSNATYYYGATDQSGAYGAVTSNFPSGAGNVTLAQREVLWIKPDQIWVYDRANSRSSTSFKNFYLDLQTTPSITGNRATMTSRKGQKLFITVLLPTNPSLSIDRLGNASGAPVTALLTSKGGTANTTRMLHVIEGMGSGSASKTSLVQSSAGTGFDGGTIGTTIVMFKRTLADAFTSTTFAASGATTVYVTGLSPNTAYAVSGAGAPNRVTTDSGGVMTFAAAGTGSISVMAPATSATAVGEHAGWTSGVMNLWTSARTWTLVLATCLGAICLGILCGSFKPFLLHY